VGLPDEMKTSNSPMVWLSVVCVLVSTTHASLFWKALEGVKEAPDEKKEWKTHDSIFFLFLGLLL
jgi:H+/Cl- antiporter ClcA